MTTLLWVVGIGVGLLIVVLAVAAVLIWPALGSAPSEEDRTRFVASAQYDGQKQAFDNRQRGLYEKMNERVKIVDAIYKMFTADGLTPKKPLPEATLDLARFREPSDSIKVVWFGHSSFMLNVHGKIILVDPVLSAHASPVFFFARRFQPTILRPENLPDIDLVVISHDHYDHLDHETITHFVGKPTPFLTPLGVGSHLRGWGIDADLITELDWWQSIVVDGITFTATPAQHFSGRDWVHNNATLWASWVIASAEQKVFFSGDSGYDTHFKEIGDKLGPFDIAFMETGQYNEQWKEIHMMPEEGAQASVDLRAKRYFPVHWGMFPLSLHRWRDPIERIYRFHENGTINLVAPIIGEIVEVSGDYQLEPWWRTVEGK